MPACRAAARREWNELLGAIAGLRFEADEPHGLSAGDRLEVRLRADVSELTQLGEVLELATDAVVVRAEQTSAALRFDAPLAY